MGQRRMARECALKMLYEIEIKKVKGSQELEDVINLSREDTGEFTVQDEKSKSFMENLVRGVFKEKKYLDGCIQEHAKNWTLERISKIDKNVMRIAIYEMKHIEEIPFAVSIDEAIEISKKYGAQDSDKFINGILDSIMKTIKLEKDAQK